MDEAGHSLGFSDAAGIGWLIQGARNGGADGIACAWTLIDEMERLFSEQADSPHAAIGLVFTQSLAKVWNDAYDVGNPPDCSTGQSPKLQIRQLIPALKALGLVAARGRRKAGGESEEQRKAAWTRIEDAANAFGCGSELEQWLADFFRALLEIRDSQGTMVDAQRLLPAFNTLHLAAPAGRPGMGDDTVMTLLAMDELARQKLAFNRKDKCYQHGDAEAARELVGEATGIDPSRLAEVRKQNADIVRIVSPNAAKDPEGKWIAEGSWLSQGELDALAANGKSAE